MAKLSETSSSSSGPDLDRLILLFTAPNSASLHDRHLASIDTLCNNNASGFALRDLPKVQQILELTFELLRAGLPGFLEPACKLVKTLGKPFVKKAATDEFKMLGNVESMLKAVGKAFDPGFPSALQLDAAMTLRSFATAHGARPNALDLAAPATGADESSSVHQYHLNQSLITNSGVARAVTRGLATAIMVSDEILVASLSATVLSFSYIPANCSQLVEMGILTCVPHLLDHGYKHDITSVAVELLWNLLEKAPETKQQVMEPQPPLAQLVKSTNAPTFQERQRQQQSQGNEQQARDETTELAASSTNASDGPTVSSAHPESDQQADGMATAEIAPAADSQRSMDSWSHLYPRLADSLSNLFLTVLGQGFREVDKELRNNVLVVLNLVLDAAPEFVAACNEAGLCPALLSVSCAPECCNGMPYVKPWALTTDELDLEHKLLCWSASTSACVLLPEVMDFSKEVGFISLLLMYLDTANPPPAVLRWNADRLSSLRSAALTCLHRVAPLSVEPYLSNGGVAVLLSLLCNCPVPIHLEAALRHLHVLCTAAPEMAEALGSGGAMGVVLDLVLATAAAWPEGLRQAALQLLAIMCSVNVENQRRFRKAEGVAALLGQLSELSAFDPTLPSPFALSVLNAVWSCIVPDRKNTAKFLVGEGMDMMLNLLERGNRSHRPLLLSVLTDMLENARAHPFFHDWRSDRNKQSAAHLLIGFWKEEDSMRGMTTGGVLANTAHPLKGLDRRTCWVPNEEVVYGNMHPERQAQLQAISKACTGEQILAKIYSVLKVVGMGSLTYVSLEDQAALYLIDKYTKFKQGEVWRQIKEEFQAEGMRPTAPDRERLASGIELSEHLARAVKDAQQQVLERHQGTIKQTETKFFEDMKAQKKYEQEMRFYQNDGSQLSLAEIREAKRKKEQMLKNSIASHHVMDSLQSTMEESSVAAI